MRDASGRSGPVVTIAVDTLGRIEVDAVDEAIEQSAARYGRTPSLVHCQWANHEVGTLQPVAEVVEHCSPSRHPDPRRRGRRRRARPGRPRRHRTPTWCRSPRTSSAARPASVPSSSVVGSGSSRFMVGGEQERARRAGLENVVAAVGFGAAAAELGRPGTLAAEERAGRQWTDRARLAAERSTGGDHVR